MKILSLILLASCLFFSQAKADSSNHYDDCGTERFSITGNLGQFDPYGPDDGLFFQMSNEAYIKIVDKLTNTVSVHKNIISRHDGFGNFEFEAFFLDKTQGEWKRSLSFFHDHEVGLSGGFYFVPESVDIYNFEKEHYYELHEISCGYDFFGGE